LLIASPVQQPLWLLSGRNSTYPAVQISRASSVLKEAGYVWIPRGTILRVRVETDDDSKPRVAEVLEVDASTARPGENKPILRKRLNGISGSGPQ
jgi:hypothetical protein